MGKGPEPDRKQPWWQQIPTWLTAIAAFLTAFGGAWVVFGPPSSPSSTTSTTLRPEDPGKVNISSILPKSRREDTLYNVAGVWQPVSPAYEVRVVGLPQDGQRASRSTGSGLEGSGQWVLSEPAQVKSDGHWTATLTVAKALSDNLAISAVVISKISLPLVEARLRESGPAAAGVAGASVPLAAPPPSP
jgi:hypothetical protein